MILFMNDNIVSYILDLLQTKGADIQYGNEDVTQLEHALQCADLAEKNNLPNPTIAAALLHDVGHDIESTTVRHTQHHLIYAHFGQMLNQ